MVNQDEWSIIFYLDDDGTSPVEEFLRGLDAKTQRRFRWSIEQLRLRNVQAREPLVRHLDGKIWELREESQTNIYRLLYFFFTSRRIVFLHGFQKKTQATPRREIEVAQRRLDHFIQRQGGAGA
jgi:phage-related protein